MPGIVCWGDSLTYGGYPEELSKMLDSKLEDIQENSNITLSMQRIRVFNEGVQGETSGEITARSGAVPYVLKRAVNLPADCAEVSIQFGIEGTDNSGKSVAFYNNETYRVILGNIRGYMNVGTRQMDGYSYFCHTFTRASEGGGSDFASRYKDVC